jgi:ligand-binding sensor domain-containing protein/signal transduction histidine kinase
MRRLLRTVSKRGFLPVVLLFASAPPGAEPQTRADRSPPSGPAVPVARVESRVVRVPVTEGDDIRFEHLTSAPGLAQTRVAEIIQDDRGFLWFGTQQGIARYDGYNFRSFTHDPALSDSLSGNFIQSLFKDRNGAIWVGTDQSLDKYDPATESFVHFHLDEHDPTVLQITEDEAGALWLATSKGLYRLNPGTRQVVHYVHDPNDSASLSSDNVQSTSRERTGTFWVITSAGLDAFDRARGKVVLHVPLPGFDLTSYCQSSCRWFHEDRFGMFWIAGDGIAALDLKTSQLTIYEGASSDFTGLLALLEDDDGTMWFGSADGLLKFDRPNSRFVRYRRSLTVPTSPAENHVIALFEDREKTIWVGLGATLPDHFARARPEFEQFQPLFDDPGNPGEDLVGAIYEDRGGGLWISANATVSRTDRKTGKRVRYHPGGPGQGASAIIEDSAGAIWFGAGDRGLSRLDKKTGQITSYKHVPGDRLSPGGDYITRILIDRAGVMWVNTLDGLNRFDPTAGRFTVYKREPGKPDPYYSVIQDRNGFLWLGSPSGLVRFLPSTGSFTVFEHNPADPRSLSSNTVSTIFEDGRGGLWVGTHAGLNKVDPKTMSFAAFYKKDGLAGNIVSCILGDDRGDLWMSTNEGISSFNPRTGKFRNYSVEDGLPGNDLTGMGACYRSSSGEMFFGGFAGAIAFYPDKLSDNPYIPPVVFTDLQINHVSIGIAPGSPLKRSITYTGDLSLSPHQNFFSIEFATLSLRNPSTNRYRYRVEGLDGDWHEVGSQERTVNFTALPPGDYGLLVQGATSRGHWSEGTKLHITVMPPWWNSWWFRVIYSILIILMVWSAYLYRLRQITHEFNVRLEERVSERTRLARDLHDTLLQSFHGLMLRFQVVDKLLPEGKAKEQLEKALERADEAIAEGRSAVYDLRSSTTTTNDLSEALNAVGNEFSTEDAAEFGLVVEGPARDLHPIIRDEVYRISREALRNAFKHARARHIEAEINYGELLFRLRIRDDGEGIPAEMLEHGRPGHYGLPGMRERARQAGGDLTIWSGLGSGTEIELSLAGPIAYATSRRRSRLRIFGKKVG